MKREILHTAVLACLSVLGVAGLIGTTIWWPEIMSEPATSLIRYLVIRLTGVFVAIPVAWHR